MENINKLRDNRRALITPLELRVLQLRAGINFKCNKISFVPPLTLKQVGQELQLTPERIRQIESKGIARIRKLGQWWSKNDG